MRRFNAVAAGGLDPDLVVLLDIPPECGRQRLSGPRVNAQLSLDLSPESQRPAGPLDRIERDSRDFHRRVREGYLEMARADPDRWLLLDASLPKDELSDLVWDRVVGMIGT